MRSLFFLQIFLLFIRLEFSHAQKKVDYSAQISSFLKEAQNLYESNPSGSLELTKKAEALALKDENVFSKAQIYTLMGNIYGIKLNRPEKAADSHKKAFQLFKRLFEQKQIQSSHFYNFFSENVSPIYDLISNENYHKKRKDKIAIRTYQSLYTELSRYFLNTQLTQKDSDALEKIKKQQQIVLASHNPHYHQQTIAQKTLALALLNQEQKKLYEQYVKTLEQAVFNKKFDISKLKKQFEEQNRAIQQKIDTLNLVIMHKDSILKRGSLIAYQKMNLLLDKQKLKNTQDQYEKLLYKQYAMYAWIAFAATAIICIIIFRNAFKSHQQKQFIQQQNEELKIINNELDQFAYRVSHDLRSPIASTLGLVNISKDETDLGQIQVYLGLMEKSLKKLDEFIKDILAHSKNARTELEIEPINLQEMIEEVISQHQFGASEKNIAIDIHIDQKEPSFYSDEYRLKLVFNNLVANAIRYSDLTKDKPFLKIEGRVESKKAILDIQDNGMGIGREHLPKIFDMFYRANDKVTGSGLGLYIVKQSIKKLGGDVSVDSEIGNGTRFHLEIPNLIAQP